MVASNDDRGGYSAPCPWRLAGCSTSSQGVPPSTDEPTMGYSVRICSRGYSARMYVLRILAAPGRPRQLETRPQSRDDLRQLGKAGGQDTLGTESNGPGEFLVQAHDYRTHLWVLEKSDVELAHFFFRRAQLARLGRLASVSGVGALALLTASQPASWETKPRLEHGGDGMGDLGYARSSCWSDRHHLRGRQGSSDKVPGSWEGTWQRSARGHSANLALPGLKNFDFSQWKPGTLKGNCCSAQCRFHRLGWSHTGDFSRRAMSVLHVLAGLVPVRNSPLVHRSICPPLPLPHHHDTPSHLSIASHPACRRKRARHRLLRIAVMSFPDHKQIGTTVRHVW